MTQAQILADTFQEARNLSLSYFSKLKNFDIKKEFEVEGKKLNSAYWIIGHLPVTENYLLLRCTGAEIVKFAWAKPFGLGGKQSDLIELVSVDEIMQIMNEVHEKAMLYVRSLTDKQLLEKSGSTIVFGDGSIRAILMHAIRHEATHAGHLGWLCKLHGVETI